MLVSRLPLPSRGALLATVALSVLLGGCVTKRDPDVTGSISGERSSLSNPSRSGAKNVDAAISQAQSLRAAGQKDQAIAVLERAVAKNRNSMPLMAAYGRALADAGRNEEALAALAKADDPKRPDWRILNSEGAILDQLGSAEEAQQRYRQALALAPGEPTVLSNLGLSHALANRPAEAEATLRQAADHPRATPKIRQNLALVLALQGKLGEAETLARRDLPPDQVAANMRYWRQTTKSQPKAAKPVKAVETSELRN